MPNRPIRIGTRGSQLALYQAEKVKEAIDARFPDIKSELVVIKSKGDKILDVSLSKIGDKGLFTKELEQAMFDDKVDLAVHSLKDLPTHLPQGLKLGGVLKRGEVRDALVSTKKMKLADLTPNLTIATSSLRRKAQLLNINPDFNIVDIRGNVNTRLRKMEEEHCDVILMAAAGLQRIGLDRYISEVIDPKQIIPAVSQGTIAMEIRSDDSEMESVIREINHPLTQLATKAERIFLRKLEGGCQIPIGCYSSVQNDTITMHGFMAYIDGTDVISRSMQGKLSEADELASALADYFINKGSMKLLERIRNFNNE
ncbi:MAG: hydroxymethylbilane synthase [Bacteroidales bacterium]|nr:hydroxymethylbilane synthase [Bacteroidales bacterium]MCF8336458.1 hydroxymethylbilane synthase [Bacteroidales bacterium]